PRRQPHRPVMNQGQDHQPAQHRDQKTDRQVHDRLDHERNSLLRAANVWISAQERCVNHNAMESRVSASQMPRYREFRWSKSGYRFSLATNAERVCAEIMLKDTRRG